MKNSINSKKSTLDLMYDNVSIYYIVTKHNDIIRFASYEGIWYKKRKISRDDDIV